MPYLLIIAIIQIARPAPAAPRRGSEARRRRAVPAAAVRRRRGMQAELLLLVIRLVIDSGIPRLVGVERAAGAAAAGAAAGRVRLFVRSRCVAPVLEGADLVVDPADHAAGRRRWVWRRGAAAAAGEWVERWGGEAQTAGPQARVEDPAAEGEDGEEDHDD